MDIVRLVYGVIQFTTLGLVVYQVGRGLALGRVEARQLTVNHRHFIIEGKLEPFPHVDIFEVVEQ